MHYKLIFSVSLTTSWGGNSPGIFKEYYKRLVTKEEAREYWEMIPTWLKAKGEISVELPEHHKLNSVLTEKIKATTANACKAMTAFRAELNAAKANAAEISRKEQREKGRKRAAAYWQKQRAKVDAATSATVAPEQAQNNPTTNIKPA
jgi:hypothetical protein